MPLTSLILPRNCSSFTMRETPTSTWRRSDHNPSSSNHRWPRPTRHWVEGNDVQSPSCKVSNLGAAAVPWLSTQLEFQEVGTAWAWLVPADSVHALLSCVLRVLSNGSSHTPWPHAFSMQAHVIRASKSAFTRAGLGSTCRGLPRRGPSNGRPQNAPTPQAHPGPSPWPVAEGVHVAGLRGTGCG